jgi:3-mercaptopyruvate sulfurtransferase SseA
MTAASILAAAGHHDLRVVVGGADDWATASGHPLKTGR